jgi:hypothetical protein
MGNLMPMGWSNLSKRHGGYPTPDLHHFFVMPYGSRRELHGGHLERSCHPEQAAKDLAKA